MKKLLVCSLNVLGRGAVTLPVSLWLSWAGGAPACVQGPVVPAARLGMLRGPRAGWQMASARAACEIGPPSRNGSRSRSGC